MQEDLVCMMYNSPKHITHPNIITFSSHSFTFSLSSFLLLSFSQYLSFSLSSFLLFPFLTFFHSQLIFIYSFSLSKSLRYLSFYLSLFLLLLVTLYFYSHDVLINLTFKSYNCFPCLHFASCIVYDEAPRAPFYPCEGFYWGTY